MMLCGVRGGAEEVEGAVKGRCRGGIVYNWHHWADVRLDN